MKIETGRKVVNLKKEAYKQDGVELTVGHVIAESLASDATGGKMKMFLLAQKAYESQEMECDAADVALMRASLESSKTYNNIIVGQALQALADAK